jgi:arabinan endo-1,5-alpha-L-arabinosidase
MLGPGGKSVLMQPADQDLIVCPDYHARTGHSALQISILIWQNDRPHAALEK